MPFTFKLSKRLALMKASLVPAAAAVLAACQLQDRRGTTGPTLPSNSVVQVVIVPDTVTLEPSQALQFLAYGRTEAGDSTAITMTWSATDGAISSGGLYTASPFQGDYQVTATLLQTSASAAAGTSAPQGVPGHSVVHVRSNPGLAQVVVVPRSASVGTGATQQFSGYGLRTNGDAAAVSVLWSATGGAISSSGLYTAGSAPGGYVVRASAVGITGQAILAVSKASVASVGVSPASANMSVGGTTQLSATPKDAAGNVLAGRLVTWTSSSSAIATVSAGGLVSGAAVGSATITATSEGQSASATITVATVPVAAVAMSPATAAVLVGATVQFTATLLDAAGNVLSGRSVTWASTGPAVATVSSTGLVTGVAPGAVTITATSEGQTGSAAVIVNPVPVASVSVSPVSAGIEVGQPVQFTATPLDANGTPLSGRSITWASSAPAVAAVSTGGLVTGVAAGTATITATSEGQGGSAAITVTVPASTSPGTVTDLAVAGVTETSVTLSFTELDDGTGAPANYDVRTAVGSTLTWWLANGALNKNGTCASPMAGTAIGTKRACTVVGLVAGTTYSFELVAFRGTLGVNAVFGGLSNIATATTSPSTAPVAAVAVSPTAASVAVGQTVQLAATLKDAGGNVLTGRTVAWASGSTGVATVSGSGLVTGVAAGTATITATSEGQSGTATVTVGSPSAANECATPTPGWIWCDDFEQDRLSRYTFWDHPESFQRVAGVGVGGSYGMRARFAAGHVLTTSYNDGAHFTWLGTAYGRTPLFDASHVGQWYCIEAHVKLNDAGQSNGVFEYWINGALETQKTGLNWLGAFSAYGINTVMFENYNNYGSPVAQDRYIDNIVVSTQRVG